MTQSRRREESVTCISAAMVLRHHHIPYSGGGNGSCSSNQLQVVDIDIWGRELNGQLAGKRRLWNAEG